MGGQAGDGCGVLGGGGAAAAEAAEVAVDVKDCGGCVTEGGLTGCNVWPRGPCRCACTAQAGITMGL